MHVKYHRRVLKDKVYREKIIIDVLLLLSSAAQSLSGITATVDRS